MADHKNFQRDICTVPLEEWMGYFLIISCDNKNFPVTKLSHEAHSVIPAESRFAHVFRGVSAC
jgi:hypothetical protein